MDTSTYPFCTLHLHLFPFSLCCECHPPCRGRLWPDTSTQNLWSQRIEPGTLQPHVSSSRCYLGHLWPGRLLQATTWRTRSGFKNVNTGVWGGAARGCVYVCVCVGGGDNVVSLPVTSPFDPQNVLNTRPLSSFAIIAEPAALRHFHIQTFPMESSRTSFTAQQTAPCKSTQHTTHDAQHTIHNAQHTTHNTWVTSFSSWGYLLLLLLKMFAILHNMIQIRKNQLTAHIC